MLPGIPELLLRLGGQPRKQLAMARFMPITHELNLADERAMEDLLLDREGPFSIYRAPVDYINAKARLVPAFTRAVIGDPLD
jgi:hypothetical protein